MYTDTQRTPIIERLRQRTQQQSDIKILPISLSTQYSSTKQYWFCSIRLYTDTQRTTNREQLGQREFEQNNKLISYICVFFVLSGCVLYSYIPLSRSTDSTDRWCPAAWCSQWYSLLHYTTV